MAPTRRGQRVGRAASNRPSRLTSPAPTISGWATAVSLIVSASESVPCATRSSPATAESQPSRSRTPGSSSQGVRKPGVWEPCPGQTRTSTSPPLPVRRDLVVTERHQQSAARFVGFLQVGRCPGQDVDAPSRDADGATRGRRAGPAGRRRARSARCWPPAGGSGRSRSRWRSGPAGSARCWGGRTAPARCASSAPPPSRNAARGLEQRPAGGDQRAVDPLDQQPPGVLVAGQRPARGAGRRPGPGGGRPARPARRAARTGPPAPTGRRRTGAGTVGPDHDRARRRSARPAPAPCGRRPPRRRGCATSRSPCTAVSDSTCSRAAPRRSASTTAGGAAAAASTRPPRRRG